ncbi:MAG: C1 family peptidase [Candidatus Thermoplasmatota archaeon]
MSFEKIIVIVVCLCFFGTIVSAVQSMNAENKTSQKATDNQIDCTKCGTNFFEEPGYPPRYVMNELILAPDEEQSPKPTVLRSLPSSFSWLNYNGADWTTPARDQGSCGSCWAFGAMSCLESRINIAWNTPTLDIDTSEQYILSCLPSSGSCNGGNSYAAFKCIKSETAFGNYRNGIIPESCLPYAAEDTVPCEDKCSDWEQKLIPITACGFWNPRYPDDINAIKSQIINEGPVVTYFYVTNHFASWGNTHHSPNDYYPYVQHDSANHAVCIVGYKDDPAIPHGGYWIVKNSWGAGWGYNGFFNIEYGSLNIDNVQITWATYEAGPQPGFEFTPKNPKIHQPIQFQDTSTVLIGEITGWLWNFGDGQTSSEQNPTHHYSEAGVYNVSLTVTDTMFHEKTITKTVFVGDDQPPVTSLIATGKKGAHEWFIGSVTIRLTAVDTFSGVDYIMYKLDTQGYQRYTKNIMLSSKNAEGRHTVSFYAVDRCGNQEAEQTVDINIDASDPALQITKPVENSLYLFNIKLPSQLYKTVVVGPLISTVTARDAISGVERVEFYLNNDLIGVDTTEPYQCLVNNRCVGSLCILKAVVYDNAGKTTFDSLPVSFSSFGLIKK